jgi:hypothetical protein
MSCRACEAASSVSTVVGGPRQRTSQASRRYRHVHRRATPCQYHPASHRLLVCQATARHSPAKYDSNAPLCMPNRIRCILIS